MQSEGLVDVSMGMVVVPDTFDIPRSLTCITLPLSSPVLAIVVFLSFGTGLPSSPLVMRNRWTGKPVSLATRSYKSLPLP